MADESPNDFTTLLLLVVERVTTLSVQVETMRALLESHGAFSAVEFEERAKDVRAKAQLAEHPHQALSRTLTLDEYSARVRRWMDAVEEGTAPPPASGS